MLMLSVYANVYVNIAHKNKSTGLKKLAMISRWSRQEIQAILANTKTKGGAGQAVGREVYAQYDPRNTHINGPYQ